MADDFLISEGFVEKLLVILVILVIKSGRSYVMATVPCNVYKASIISVILNNCLFRDTEAILILVSAISKFENLLRTFASQRALATFVDADWRS